jgi:hypothetical protein
VGTSSNRARATCPTVAMNEAVDRLPVATEGYGPSVQRHIVVVIGVIISFMSNYIFFHGNC